MTMKKAGLFGLLAAFVLSTGCIDTTTHIQVDPDGSGAILLSVYVSEAAIEQMAGGMMAMMAEGMGAMMEGMADAFGDAMPGADVSEQMKEELAGPSPAQGMERASLYDEAQLVALAAAFGDGVRFDAGQERVRDDGWKGFIARYVFNDIRKIGVDPEFGDILPELQEGMPIVPMSGFTFDLTGSNPATLSISMRAMPSGDEADGESDSMAVEWADFDDAFGDADGGIFEMGLDGADGQDMEDMMLQAMRGKRDRIVLTVNGNVLSATAPYPSRANANVFMLFLMDYDRIMDDPDARAAMEDDSMTLDGLIDLDSRGLRSHRPGSTVEIVFE